MTYVKKVIVRSPLEEDSVCREYRALGWKVATKLIITKPSYLCEMKLVKKISFLNLTIH